MTNRKDSPQLPWFPGIPAEIVDKALEATLHGAPAIGLDTLTMSIIGAAIYVDGQQHAHVEATEAAHSAVLDAIKTDLAQDHVRMLAVISAASGLMGSLDDAASQMQIAFTEAAAAVGIFVGATLARINPTFNPSFPDPTALNTHILGGMNAYRAEVAPDVARLKQTLKGQGASASKGVA